MGRAEGGVGGRPGARRQRYNVGDVEIGEAVRGGGRRVQV